MEYEVVRYKGNEWGIWGKSCKCFIVFGAKRDLIRRAQKLNKVNQG